MEQELQRQIAAEVGRLRLSEIEAQLVVAQLKAENDQLSAQVVALQAQIASNPSQPQAEPTS